MKVTQSCPTLCNPMDYTVHRIPQARILEWVAFPFSRGSLPNPVIEPRSPTSQTDSLPAGTQGKPKNTRVGSLSLLQGIFLTHESNQGLLHCRQILYQLSYMYTRVRNIRAEVLPRENSFFIQMSPQRAKLPWQHCHPFSDIY